jgi:uncharacterized SAM-binding protein YcdF (DUF218 family)
MLTPLDNWWANLLAGNPAGYPPGSVLVVLGGGVLGDDIMAWNSYLRSVFAVRNFRTGKIGKVVVTGGSRSGKPAAFAMSDWIRCHGVPNEDLYVETASQSTRENALATRQLLNSLPGPKVLLTSDYHIFRARRVFARLNMPVLPQPVPDVRLRASYWADRWSAFCDLAVETVKIGYYWARGWI